MKRRSQGPGKTPGKTNQRKILPKPKAQKNGKNKHKIGFCKQKARNANIKEKAEMLEEKLNLENKLNRHNNFAPVAISADASYGRFRFTFKEDEDVTMPPF